MNNSQTAVYKIVSVWQEHFKNHPDNHNIDWISANNTVLSQIPQSNLMTVIFSFADLKIFHINQAAADYFGSSIEEIKQVGASLLISSFDEEQLKFALFSAEKIAIEYGTGNFKNPLNGYTCYNNWMIHNKKGIKQRALFRIFSIELNEKGLPLTGMYLIHDIKPFVKGDTWWCRSVMDGKTLFHYQSEEKKLLTKDLLSKREKTLLHLLASGLSSKEIAAELKVSNHTIDNHRRRMLSKTGAVDTSALIHIAKLSGLL